MAALEAAAPPRPASSVDENRASTSLSRQRARPPQLSDIDVHSGGAPREGDREPVRAASTTPRPSSCGSSSSLRFRGRRAGSHPGRARERRRAPGDHRRLLGELDPSEECVARVSAPASRTQTAGARPSSAESPIEPIAEARLKPCRDELGADLRSRRPRLRRARLQCLRQRVRCRGRPRDPIELQMPGTIKRFDPVRCGLAAVMDPTP